MIAATNFALLHGGGLGSWVWTETISALRAQSGGAANCIALDVPGCGTKRGRDTGAIEFDEVACELNADIEAAGMRDVVLVGHSQAGMVLPRMVEFAPSAFRRLIYVSCSAPPPGVSILELMGDCVHGEREDKIGWPVDPKTTPVAELFGAMFCNDMSSCQRDNFLAKLGQDSWPLSTYIYADWRYNHLSSIPGAFVLCLQDTSLPPPWQERFARMLKVEQIVRIDAGHHVMNTQPEALAQALLSISGQVGR
ncbi:MAG: alpha/beta hydrolase [Chloroflexi bacterium]|nr:alpha/beta hydrolase [Chloroflexota bacterium]